MSQKHRCFARCALLYYDDNDIMVRKGGVAIFWKIDLNCVITKLDNIDNDRIIGIKIAQNDVRSLYIFNVYLPSSNYPYDEFYDCMIQLIELITHYKTCGNVLIIGDLNTSID